MTALAITHTKVSAIADDATASAAGEVLPSDWNAGHALSGTLPAAQFPALTGDVTTVAAALGTTLATVNGNVGTFGSATKASVVTVNAKGLATAASETTITPAVGSVTGLGTGVATFLATPSSANLAAALTDETGTGAAVFANAPTLVGPILGTPASGNLSNCTALPVASVTGLAANVATFLATPSSANFAAAMTDETGTGANVFANTPALVTPAIGAATGTSLVATQSIAAVSTDGLVVTNTTAAAAGAQQWSPRIRWTGQGWKTTATAASQTADWIAEVQPVQGANLSASLVFNSQINGGGYSAATVIKFGSDASITWGTGIVLAGTGSFSATNASSGISFFKYNNAGVGIFSLRSGSSYGWTNDATDANGALDASWSRSAAAVIQQGAANAASPVAQTLQAQGSRSGTDSNVGGANYTLAAGNGTGTGTLSSLILQSPILVASGTGAQTPTTGLTIKGGMAVTAGYAVASLPTGITGAIVHVTDQLTTPAAKGVAPTGGGSVKCLVMYDGSAWVGI